MKKTCPKDGQHIARPTPPLPEIALPAEPVAMNSSEYDQLMRKRIQTILIEKHAARVKH